MKTFKGLVIILLNIMSLSAFSQTYNCPATDSNLPSPPGLRSQLSEGMTKANFHSILVKQPYGENRISCLYFGPLAMEMYVQSYTTEGSGWLETGTNPPGINGCATPKTGGSGSYESCQFSYTP